MPTFYGLGWTAEPHGIHGGVPPGTMPVLIAAYALSGITAFLAIRCLR